MPYTAKDYGNLIGMAGFSETILKNHFTLYQGYVTNTNKALDALGAMLSAGKTATPEYAEIKRRAGWKHFWNEKTAPGCPRGGPCSHRSPFVNRSYFFARFLRPSASFSASPSFWAIFFLASE